MDPTPETPAPETEARRKARELREAFYQQRRQMPAERIKQIAQLIPMAEMTMEERERLRKQG